MFLAELINVEKEHYLYDALFNQIIHLEDNIYNYLIDGELRSNNYLDYSLKLLHYGIRDVFIPQQFEIKYHFSDDELKWHIENKMQQLTLSMTEKCNMRCEYCAYLSKYTDYHNGVDMSRNTAFMAIEYFLKHSTYSPKVGITFYGGEPLICFDLITECIDYAKKKRLGHNIIFNIITNGLLLSDHQIRKYLCENQIYICISMAPEIFMIDIEEMQMEILHMIQ